MLFRRRGRLLYFNHFASAAFGLNLGASRRAERVGAHRQLFGQFAVAENLDQLDRPIGQTGIANRLQTHFRSVIELIQRIEIHPDVTRRMAGIVKAALGHTPDQRHLSTFKANADRAAGTGRLALATPPCRLATAAGFTLTKALAAVLGARTGL